MRSTVNENGIDQRNKSGQANRPFQGGQSISIFNHHVKNCLRQARLDITLFGCQYISYQFLGTLSMMKYNVVDQIILEDRILC